MKSKTLQKIIIIIFTLLLIIMSSTNTFAEIKPSDITGEATDESIELEFVDRMVDLVRIIGSFVAVGAMMIIGIKYMSGSLEEKANYKKSMMPYLIGCFILFGASIIAPQIKELFDNMGTSTEKIGNLVIGIIKAVGTIITVAVMMLLGIKYMMGSAEEKASYKKSMIPYLVGVVLLFGAVNLTGAMYDIITNGDVGYSYDGGINKGKDYILSGKNATEVDQECKKAKKKLEELEKNNPESKEIEYWKGYIKQLENHLNEMIK